MPSLRFTAGPLAGRRVEVPAPLVLGRQADLVVDDPQVSRRHAVVRPDGDRLEVEDLGSLNGTWVNEARVDGTVRLAPGDRVRLGDTTFEVEGAVPAAATVASVVPAPAPATPFRPPPQRPGARRPGIATRRLTPTVLSFGTVIVTAVALVIYFAMR